MFIVCESYCLLFQIITCLLISIILTLLLFCVLFLNLNGHIFSQGGVDRFPVGEHPLTEDDEKLDVLQMGPLFW